MPGKLDKWIWSNSRETGIREASRSAVKAGIAHLETTVLNGTFKKSRGSTLLRMRLDPEQQSIMRAAPVA